MARKLTDITRSGSSGFKHVYGICEVEARFVLLARQGRLTKDFNNRSENLGVLIPQQLIRGCDRRADPCKRSLSRGVDLQGLTSGLSRIRYLRHINDQLRTERNDRQGQRRGGESVDPEIRRHDNECDKEARHDYGRYHRNCAPRYVHMAPYRSWTRPSARTRHRPVIYPTCRHRRQSKGHCAADTVPTPPGPIGQSDPADHHLKLVAIS